jgi:hypothetical protein
MRTPSPSRGEHDDEAFFHNNCSELRFQQASMSWAHFKSLAALVEPPATFKRFQKRRAVVYVLEMIRSIRINGNVPPLRAEMRVKSAGGRAGRLPAPESCRYQRHARLCAWRERTAGSSLRGSPVQRQAPVRATRKAALLRSLADGAKLATAALCGGVNSVPAGADNMPVNLPAVQ